MIVEKISVKSVVRKCRIDDWWWSEASLNPYQGCWHDCKYCDGKSENYHMHVDYGTRIKGKINAPQLLERFFRKENFLPVNRQTTSTLVDFIPDIKGLIPQNKGKFIFGIGGGVCDVYQPAEKKLNITRKLLQIIYDYDFPLFLLTKNKLVLRDLDLLEKIQTRSYANVSFSITLADEKTQKLIEPHSTPVNDRFDALKRLRKAGIHAGVFFLPVLPWIGDTDENMRKIFEMAKEADAEFVVAGGLTLKPGRQKQEFFALLEEFFPSLKDKYTLLYSNNNKYGQLDSKQAKSLQLINPVVKACEIGQKFGIPSRMPRYIPEGRIRTNLKIATVLFRISFSKHLRSPYLKKIHQFREAAYFLDKYDSDIGKMSHQEIKNLPFSKEVTPFILEYLETGRCNYLMDTDESNSLFYN